MKHLPRRRLRLFPARRCVCGLRWPCPDRYAWPPNTPVPDGNPPSRPTWNDPTTHLDQLGRAGALTPAQAWRASPKGRR